MFRFLFTSEAEEITCELCKRSSIFVSKALKVCGECIRTSPEAAQPYIEQAHQRSRARFGLPGEPPNDRNGVECKICVNSCKIPENERGFCGLRTNQNGRLQHIAGTSKKGILEWYYDPLPTNCVSNWVCPGGTGAGFPKFSYTNKKPEHGYKNLAVFYGACTFDCLFCQNWQYRKLSNSSSPTITSQELAEAVDDKTSCICYFGGDPTPQIMHAIKASQIAIDNNKNRILRICWESNGSMARKYLKTAAELSLTSGGCVKFDLKTMDENLNKALCGVTNKQTLANFEYLSDLSKERPAPPMLIASTLLVPGYVEEDEVKRIAEFISSLDPEIPYSLLAFHPQFEMEDLPVTSKKQALVCLNAAEGAGLKRVKLGNIHLLG